MSYIDPQRVEIMKEAARIAEAIPASTEDDTEKRCARISQIFHTLIALATKPD